MLMNVIKKTMPMIIMIGLIGIMTNFLFALESGYLAQTTVNGITMYYIDVGKWIANINTALTTNPIDMDDILPTGSYIEIDSANVLEAEFWEAIINNIAYTFNWLYAPINVILLLVRWIAYIARCVLVIFGWPMTQTNGSYDSILITVLTSIMEYLKIPYIPTA